MKLQQKKKRTNTNNARQATNKTRRRDHTNAEEGDSNRMYVPDNRAVLQERPVDREIGNRSASKPNDQDPAIPPDDFRALHNQANGI